MSTTNNIFLRLVLCRLLSGEDSAELSGFSFVVWISGKIEDELRLGDGVTPSDFTGCWAALFRRQKTSFKQNIWLISENEPLIDIRQCILNLFLSILFRISGTKAV